METPNADKLVARKDEWNAIFRFIEWLHKNKMCIGVWRDPEAPYENLYTGEIGTIKEDGPHLLEHPYPYGQTTHNLLYEYFDVNPAELERERRATLANIREGNVSFTRVK